MNAGSITFSTALDNAQLEKDLSRLKKQILKIEDDLSQNTFKKNALTEQLKAAAAEREELQNVVSNAAVRGTESSQKALNRFLELGRLISELEAKIKKYDSAIADSNLNLDAAKNRFGELASAAGHLLGAEQLRSAPSELDPQLQEMSDKAMAANQSITELNEQIVALQEQQANLGWAPNHGWAFGEAAKEYNDLTSQIEAINQEIISCEAYLDEMAENGDLGKLASGAEIAKERIDDLTQYLADLQAQQDSLGLAWGAREEYEQLTAEIERVNQLLETYRKNLFTSEDSGLDNLAQNAEIANQRVVDLNRELLELKERQSELETAGLGLGYEEYDEVFTRIAEINKELKEYQEQLKNIGDGGEKPLNRTAQAAEKMNSILAKSNTTFKTACGAVNSLSAAAAGLQTAALATSGAFSQALQIAGAAVQQFAATASAALAAVAPYLIMIGLIVQLAKAIEDAAKKLGEAIGKAIKERITSFTYSVRDAAIAAKDLAVMLGGKAAKAFESIADKLAPIIEDLNVLPKLTQALAGKMKSLWQRIRRVFLLSVMTSWMRSMRTQMQALLRMNVEFAASFGRLKGSLLTAIQPIYDAVIPALTVLINVLARAAAAVAQFIAALFGTTAKQAQSNAEALYNQANAAAAAGSAAEEASKSLAAFDEINKLADDSSANAGAGAGASTEITPLFDWDFDETPFDTWGEAFYAFLDHILNKGIPTLEEGLSSFAGWLNTFSGNLYEMFTFPGVKEKVEQVGQGLADAVDGFAEMVQWEQLGNALGAGFDTAITLANSFIGGTSWDKLGADLAGFVNGLVDVVDWEGFGELLWGGWKIGMETLAGFILELDVPAIANAAGDTAAGFFHSMKKTIEGIKWEEIGSQIGEFLTNLKWDELLSSVGGAIAAGINSAVKLARGFLDMVTPELGNIASGIVKNLKNFFDSNTGVNWKDLAAAISDGIKAALSFVSGLLDNDLFYTIGKAIGDFFIGIDWVGILGGLAETLANAVNSAVSMAKGFLDTVQPHLMEIADGIAEKINKFFNDVNWEDLGKTISRGIEAALDFMIELVKKIDWDKIGESITTLFESIDWDTLMTKWGELMGEIAGAKLKLIDVSGAVDVGVNIVRGLLGGIIAEINATPGGLLGWLASHFVGPLISSFLSLLGIHSPSTVFAEYGKYLVEGFLLGISESWSTITNFFGEKLEGIKQTLSSAWESIKETASTVFGSIKDKIGSIWGGVKEDTDTSWAGTKDSLDTTWSAIGSAADEIFSGIQSAISGFWDETSSDTSAQWAEIDGCLGTAWDGIEDSAETAFESTKSTIAEKWAGTSAETSEMWSAIDSSLSSSWDGIQKNAESKFGSTKNTISGKWSETERETSSKWQTIESNLGGEWNNVNTTASQKFDTVKSTISNIWNGLISSAATWGSDICANIANGIKSAAGKVTSAVKSVAGTIKDYLGFSEPKLGPLSNFHTYMPDMLELMARGIKDNMHIAVNAASGLADAVANSVNRRAYCIGNVNLSALPDLSKLQIPRLAQGAVIPANREFMAVLGDQSSGNNIEAPESLIRRIVREESGGNNTALLEAILEAVKAGHIIMVDRRELGRTVTQEQNRMTRQSGRSVLLG